MKNFEYAQPLTEEEAVELLGDLSKETAVLAGGTDLVGLMKRMVATPDRVVNISDIPTLKRVRRDEDGNLWIGAAVSLDDCRTKLATQPNVSQLAAIEHVIRGISSLQLQSQGTVVGELLRRPTCWYFRNGHGLLADAGRLAVNGDNRYHAILGNRGPAKFVSASRLAPALIAMGAHLRVIGGESEEQFLDLRTFYQTPSSDMEREHVLEAGQLVTHIVIPSTEQMVSAAYEVRHGEGPDQPLATAAVSLRLSGSIVEQASIVMGQVAPVPWVATAAARALVGQRPNEFVAEQVGIEATVGAMPLSHNEYKVQLAQVAVKRAILRAVGLETGGSDLPNCSQAALA